MTSAAALARELEERRADRAVVRARRAFGGERLERRDEAGLHEQLAGLEQRAAGRVHARAFAQRHHRLEHAQTCDVRGRHRDAAPREFERRLDEPLPRQSAVRLPQRAEPGGHARHRARRRSDGVVHELRAERHLELHELRVAPLAAEPGHRAEEVEVARDTGRSVVVDRVAAAEQPRHHRLRDARCKRCSDGRVGRVPSVSEDLDTGACRGRVAGRDACDHGETRGNASQPTRATSARGTSSRWLCSTPSAKPNTPPPIERAG